MKQITKNKLIKLEHGRKQDFGNINDVIIYNGTDPDEPEKSIRRFNNKYPGFDGTIIFLPDNGRDD